MVIFVVAAAENNALGKDNQLLWHLPDDFKRFKQITSGHSIIMGRKTFESLPGMLPNRKHIIITRQKDFNPEHCTVVDSIEKALEAVPENENAFVIGGGEIYNLAMPFADKIELTRVHVCPDADTFFPELDAEKWQLTESEFHPKDDRHKYEFDYETYMRI